MRLLAQARLVFRTEFLRRNCSSLLHSAASRILIGSRRAGTPCRSGPRRPPRSLSHRAARLSLQAVCPPSSLTGRPQHTQVAPERDIVPAPIFLSYSRRCAAVAALGCGIFAAQDAENGSGLVRVRLDLEQNALVIFLAEPFGLEQGHRRAAVLAFDRSRPQIGDGRLAIDSRIEAFKVSLRPLQAPIIPTPARATRGPLRTSSNRRQGQTRSAAAVRFPSRRCRSRLSGVAVLVAQSDPFKLRPKRRALEVPAP